MTFYYIVIPFYPLISVVILKVLGEDGDILKQILNEYYLWGGITLFYCALLIALLFGTGHLLSAVISFIFYTIVYFGISIARKTIWTESDNSGTLAPNPPE